MTDEQTEQAIRSALGEPYRMSMNTHTYVATTKTWRMLRIAVDRVEPGRWRGSCRRRSTSPERWHWWINAETIEDAFDQCWELAEQAVAE